MVCLAKSAVIPADRPIKAKESCSDASARECLDVSDRDWFGILLLSLLLALFSYASIVDVSKQSHDHDIVLLVKRIREGHRRGNINM